MRGIRLQLKSGFMKTEPKEYTFLKRYPPIHRDTKPAFHKADTRKIPYLDLLHKVAARNPSYDDRVYPTFWRHETTRLTIAKKQYQFMQAGDSENEAFRKAEAYVNEIESKSYEELRDLRNALQRVGAQVPFMQNDALASEIQMWREKIQNDCKSYNNLDIADQGELDYFIQTKIMNWNEVERERRMKDPVFARQFRKLRKSIFPDNQELVEGKKLERQRFDMSLALEEETGIDLKSVKASAPFYVEDYIKFFEMFKNQPNVRMWTIKDRAAVSSWIINTLAIRHIVDRAENHTMKQYLDMLKSQYFPMARCPEKAASYATPTVESVRKALYENDVGYKTEQGKLYVRRFYKLPVLLFPVEAMAASLMMSNVDYVEGLVAEGEEPRLLDEIRNAGMGESSLAAVKEQLKDYLARYKMDLPDYEVSNSDGADPLDALIKDATSDLSEGSTTRAIINEEELERMISNTSDSSAELSLDASSSSDDDDLHSSSSSSDSSDSEDEQEQAKEQAYARKCAKQPALSRSRDRYYGLSAMPHDSDDEDEMENLYESRVQLEFDERVRLEAIFNEKEDARRARSWEKRRLWKLPRPYVPVVGLNEV